MKNVTITFPVIRAVSQKLLTDFCRISKMNIPSLALLIESSQRRVNYSASKVKVINLTKSIAIEQVENSVRENASSPGTIKTLALFKRRQERINKFNTYETVYQWLTKCQIIKRPNLPDEIRKFIIYFSADDSACTSN